MDLHMLASINGRERIRAEFERLLDASGVDVRRALPVEGRTGATVLEAHARVAGRTSAAYREGCQSGTVRARIPAGPWNG
jgi:hypothetical protein